MMLRTLLVACLAMLITGCASPGGPTAEGLVPVASSKVDELYVRPDAAVATYRRVFIEPVAVQFRSDYLRQRNSLNYLLAEPMSPPYQDADALAKDMAGLMYASLVDAFRAASYEVVGGAGPGVLRVSARINDLFVNAPDRFSSSVRTSFNRDTGQATLGLEASDAQSGALVARVVHHAIVREISRFNRATDTSNRMWFDTAFRRWATNVVGEFGASRRTDLSRAD